MAGTTLGSDQVVQGFILLYSVGSWKALRTEVEQSARGGTVSPYPQPGMSVVSMSAVLPG